MFEIFWLKNTNTIPLNIKYPIYYVTADVITISKRIQKRDTGDNNDNAGEENEGIFQKIWNYVKKQVVNILINTVVGWFIG